MTYYPEFKESTAFTIGVEVEFQLVDSKSLDLVPKGPQILNKVSKDYSQRIKPEFIKSMLEVNTGKCNNLVEVERDLKAGIIHLQNLAKETGAMLFSTSLHPFALSSTQELSDDKRYHELMEEFQIVGRRLITQGLHVHIGIDDPDSAVKIVDKIRTYIPFLLAVSASSPFFEGEDTGLCSFRSKLFDALPRSGIPDPLDSWENFQVLANLLYQAGIIESARDIWWDVRPHPIFGTVEVRICDVPIRFKEIMALVAFIRMLVEYLYHNDKTSSKVHRSILLNNKWNACRYGLEGIFVNPFTLEKQSIRAGLVQFLTKIHDYFIQYNAQTYMNIFEQMLQRGCSANFQRRLLKEKGGDFKAMMHAVMEEFWS